MRWRLATSLLRPAESSNCEPDDDEVMQLDYPIKTNTPTSTVASSSESTGINHEIENELSNRGQIDCSQPCSDFDQLIEDESSVGHEMNLECTYDNVQESVLRANAVTYLSGVIIHYVQKKYKCVICARYEQGKRCFRTKR